LRFSDLYNTINPEDCKTKSCAKDGMDKGLQVVILSVISFWLLSFEIITKAEKDSTTIITALGLLTFGFTVYGLYKWRAYRERYKELLLQEAIAKGVEIGMKKAKKA